MENYEKSKFVFSETFNNENGKTSGSGFIGVVLGILSGLGFLGGIIGWLLGFDGSNEILSNCIIMATIAGGLLATRKVATSIGTKKVETNN